MTYIIFDLEWNQPFANDISFMKRTGLPVSGGNYSNRSDKA